MACGSVREAETKATKALWAKLKAGFVLRDPDAAPGAASMLVFAGKGFSWLGRAALCASESDDSFFAASWVGQPGERGIRGQLRGRGLEQRPVGQLGLQGLFGGARGFASGLHLAAPPVPVAVTDSGLDLAGRSGDEQHLAERPDRQTRTTHRTPPSYERASSRRQGRPGVAVLVSSRWW